MGQAGLLDAAQPLKERMLDQAENNAMRYAHEPVDRVIEDLLIFH